MMCLRSVGALASLNFFTDPLKEMLFIWRTRLASPCLLEIQPIKINLTSGTARPSRANPVI